MATAICHFMNTVAQASSVASDASVQAVLTTCMARAGTKGAKKSLMVPVTVVPPRVVMASGLVAAMAGRTLRCDHFLPAPSVVAITV